MMPDFSYIRPETLKEVVKHLAPEGSGVLAGGTDLLGCLRDRVFDLKKMVSITGLAELRGITKTADGGLRIGALATLTEIAENPFVKERYPALAQGASEAASPQLRNQGTLGGNLCQKPRCWYYRGEFHCLRKGGDRCFAVEGENQYHCIFGGGPCFIVHPSDTAPALVGYGASVHVSGTGGNKSFPVEKLFVLPSQNVMRETVLERGEIVTEILLPPPAEGVRSSYRKVKARQSWDFAIAGVALALRFDGERVTDARIVLSGAAPIPWRSNAVEQTLTGQVLKEDSIRKAAAAAVENAQPLEHNGYKVALFKGLIEEELMGIAKA